MIHVHVWLPTQETYGHSSMYIERQDPAQSCYVSWWPTDAASLPGSHSAVTHDYNQDVTAERRPPERSFMLNLGHEYLAEMPMVHAWRAWKQVPVWAALARNCCTTVAFLLREPGGGTRYSDWEPATWWDPHDIVTYMGQLSRHFVMVLPPAPRVPSAS